MNASAQAGRDFRKMRVAQIRELRGADHVQVLFLESARIYRLLRKNPAYDRLLALLLDALKSRRAVQVRFGAPAGDVVEDVQERSPGGD